MTAEAWILVKEVAVEEEAANDVSRRLRPC